MVDEITKLESSVKEKENQIRKLEELEREFTKKQSEVYEKRATLKNFEEQIKEYRSKIKEEFQGTKSELTEFIRNYDKECDLKHNQCRKMERDYTKKEIEWKQLDQKRVGLVKEEGMLQQEENVNRTNIKLMDELLLQVIATLKEVKATTGKDVMSTSFSSCLEACDGESGGSMTFESVMKTMNSALKMKDNELQKVKDDFAEEERSLQVAINDVRATLASKKKERDMFNKQLAESKKAHLDLKTRLNNLEGSTERLALLDDEEDTFVNQIEQIETSGFMVKCDSEIKNLVEEVKGLEEEISKLSDIVNILSTDKSKTDQISLLNRQKLQKQNDCNEKMRNMEDDLKTVMEVEDLPKDNLAAAVDSKLKGLTQELKSKRAQLKTNEQALANAKSELKFTLADLKKREATLKG